jgi:hypothetical protein
VLHFPAANGNIGMLNSLQSISSRFHTCTLCIRMRYTVS